MTRMRHDGETRLSRREAIGRVAGASLGIVSALSGTERPASAEPADQAVPARRSKGMVNTVLGPLDAAKLGFTLTHEHICPSSAGFWQAWPEFFGPRTTFIAKLADKLKAARDEGVETYVDLTTIDLGRNIRLLEEVSRKSGMQIIACTGHWIDPTRSMSVRSVGELTDFFVKEIERGIEGTGIKPGVIKMATDRDGVTPFLEKALTAGARASKATGLPIVTHSYSPGRIGEKQAEIFEREGVSPSNVCLGHSDDTDNMEYLLGLAKRGYTVGMDRLPYGIQPPGSAGRGSAPGFVSWQKRAECIKGLVDGGFSNRVVLSHDWGLFRSVVATGGMEPLEKQNPDGILFATRKVIPFLKQIGVSDQAIHAMTVDNQKRLFGGV